VAAHLEDVEVNRIKANHPKPPHAAL
jgi:hypothetical protein